MSDIVWDFHGKRFVVVGASSGIGRQIAVELASAGAEVLAIARSQERLDNLAAQSSLITTAQLDVTKASCEDWTELLGAYVSEHGKVHGGVYTAGIVGITPLRGYDEAFARNIVETSFWGAVHALQGLSKRSVSVSGASFVLFSSVAWKTCEKGMFAYSAAKAALVAAVQSFAHDLARDKKRINSISPGYVRTEMTCRIAEVTGVPEHIIQKHLFGIGEPEQVTGMVMFLLSDRANWITGEDFVVDGGNMRGAWN